ncbi:MAG TPA: hypothetical protein VHI13_10420 [Candidatus Kapabacteria bacterium]|nr:hypothetical protein [Candidatus Kapabacteria bacterium]
MPNNTIHSSWTPRAAGVLARACEGYGGADAWRAIRVVRLVPTELRGMIPWMKGFGRTFSMPSAFEIFPRDRQARFLDYPERGCVGAYHDGAVRIERATGELLTESRDHRRTFHGLAKYRRWTPADALYFFGYALTHYHSLPFTLGDARLIESSVAGTRSAPLDVLNVEFPAELHTHCRRQRFYIDEAGSIVRHDYHAEVVGWPARGAHYWNRQHVVNGFPIALERHVVARVGSRTLPFIVALHAAFRAAEVEHER